MRIVCLVVLSLASVQDRVRIDAPKAQHYLPADAKSFTSPIGDLEKITPAGTPPRMLAYGRSQLWGIGDGNRVTDGKTVLVEAESIAFDGDELWTAGAGKIQRVSPEGKVVESFDSPAPQPRGLAVSGEHLIVADQEKLYVLTRKGRAVETYRSPSKDTCDLACHGNQLLVADAADKAVYVLSKTGWVVLSIPLDFAPMGVASDGRSIWISGESTLVKTSLDTTRKFILGEKQSAKIVFTGNSRGLLALPWNMNRQKIGPIDADSKTVKQDRWGQPAVESKSIAFSAEFYDIQYFIWPDAVKGEIPADIKSAYRVDGDMLKINDPLIQEGKRWVTQSGKETRPYELLQRAYAYTTDRIYYAKGGGWPDAPTALRRGTGTCSPISFVFVAICRASGLPARFQAGTRFRGSPRDQEFHRWCEVFLPGYGWVPADPSACGKSPTPAHRAKFLGHVPNIDLIMTLGGGGSEFFGWGYNSQKGGAAVWSDMRKEKSK